MSEPNPSDPSTWSSDNGYNDNTPFPAEPAGGAEPDAESAESLEDLYRRHTELTVALDGARRKLERLRSFADAGEAEVGRLTRELELTDAAIDRHAEGN